MVLRPFPRRRCPLLLVLSTRHPIRPRSFPIQELHRTFRAHEAAAERAQIARLRAGRADQFRPGRLITRGIQIGSEGASVGWSNNPEPCMKLNRSIPTPTVIPVLIYPDVRE